MTRTHACSCDDPEHDHGPSIPAGLDAFDRQLDPFGVARRRMLADVHRHPALRDWRTRADDDLGVMLLDLWAYVCDVVSFYDEVIAHESYVRTAQRRASLRRLIGVLGYQPRPAVGSRVVLAATLRGREPRTIPAGMQVRSGAVAGGPPQVFEIDRDTAADPHWNRWALLPSRPDQLDAHVGPTLLARAGRLHVTPGDLVLVEADSLAHVASVVDTSTVVAPDGNRYPGVQLAHAPDLGAGTALASIRVRTPTRQVGLSLAKPLGSDPPAITIGTATTTLVLDGVVRGLHVGDRVIVTKGDDERWFTVSAVAQQDRTVAAAATSTAKDGKGVTTATFTSPSVNGPVTVVTLDASLNDPTRRRSPSAAPWTDADFGALRVHFGMVEAAVVQAAERVVVEPSDPLAVATPVALPRSKALPGRFVLQPQVGDGVEVTGSLDPTDGRLHIDASAGWNPPLPMPITVQGNVVDASRGETVPREVLGSGNGAVPSQTFTLAKYPLTYLSAATAENDWGVESTLVVWVAGLRWREVPSFYGTGPHDQVYVVRETDDGRSRITFGDGVRGGRLPTGRDNVVARYRFGAEAPMPSAGGVSQLARPVPGVSSITNPLPAAGGADREGAESLRTNAPRSALLLGRVVSVADVEAVILGSGAVRAVQAEWRWHRERQCALVHVFYVGDPQVASSLAERVRAISDPTLPLVVEPAVAAAHGLSIDVQVDPRRSPEAVARAVADRLRSPGSVISPERLGVGRPLFYSRLFEAILEVPGVVTVAGCAVDGIPIGDDVALVVSTGAWLDVADADLVVSGASA